MDKFFWWFNEHDEARLAVALIGGPGSSVLLTRSGSPLEAAAGVILLLATATLAIAWGYWVDAHANDT